MPRSLILARPRKATQIAPTGGSEDLRSVANRMDEIAARGVGVFFDENIDLAEPVGSELLAQVLAVLKGGRDS